MRPYLGYIRVSRVGDRNETLTSPDFQAQRIEQFAEVRGLPLLMLKPELDVSGGKLDRPILGDALRQVEAGEASGLIVAQLDRLSRLSLVDALKVIQRVEAAGGEVLAAGENFDTSTPEGRLGRNVFLSIGEMQLERYKAQFAESKRQAVERGIWPVPRIPLGYRRGHDRRLEPDPETAPKIERAFEMRSQGKPWAEIADFLGYGTGGAMRLLRNRVYLGEVNIKDILVNTEAHKPIIGRALFEAAQARYPPAQRTGTPRVLGGMIRCADCRCLMSSDNTGKAVYRCQPKKSGWTCPSPAIISHGLIEPYVIEAMLEHIGHLTFGAHQGPTKEFEAAERRVQDAEAELQAFQAATRAADIGVDAFATGLRHRNDEAEQARRDLAELHSHHPLIPEFGGNVRGLWPELDVYERRHLLRGTFGVVWVRRGRRDLAGRVRMIERGYEPRDLPRPGFRRADRVPVDFGNLDGVIEPASMKNLS